MTAAEGVRERLLDVSAFTALVSGRVWTAQLPQKVDRPAALVQQISEVQSPHLRGTVEVMWGRVQVTAVAATLAEARAVDQAAMGTYQSGLPTGLRGFAGVVGGSPANFHITSVEVIDYREIYLGDALKEYRCERDYRVQFRGVI